MLFRTVPLLRVCSIGYSHCQTNRIFNLKQKDLNIVVNSCQLFVYSRYKKLDWQSLILQSLLSKVAMLKVKLNILKYSNEGLLYNELVFIVINSMGSWRNWRRIIYTPNINLSK
jgi:hypothetical protein